MRDTIRAICDFVFDLDTCVGLIPVAILIIGVIVTCRMEVAHQSEAAQKEAQSETAQQADPCVQICETP